MKNKKDKLQSLKNIGFVVLGTLILSLGTALFVIPNNLVIGGVSGLAIIFDKIIPSELFTVDLLVAIITWLLFLLGLIVLGKAFALKTLVSTIVYPVGVSVFLRLSDPSVLGGFFSLSQSAHGELGIIVSAIFGGVFVGLGCAVTFLGGGSSGGIDILVFIVCKIWKRMKSSVVFFMIDAITVIFGMFVIGDFVLTLLGILSVFISAVVVDKLFLGSKSAFVAEIVTENFERINRSVIEELNRTTTILEVTGGYSGEKRKMLKVSFSVRQYSELIKIISRHDKNAFVTFYRAHEINGEGWNK